jgi:hypothetical protein
MPRLWGRGSSVSGPERDSGGCRLSAEQIAKGGSPPCRKPVGNAPCLCQNGAWPLWVVAIDSVPILSHGATSFALWYGPGREGRQNRGTGALLSHAQVLPNFQPSCNRFATGQNPVTRQIECGRRRYLALYERNWPPPPRGDPQLVHKTFSGSGPFAGRKTVVGRRA